MVFDAYQMDDFKQQYEDSKVIAQYVEAVEDATLFDVFTDTFMRDYTRFKSLDDFFAYGGWEVSSEDDLDTVPEQEFEEYVATYTVFDDSNEMLQKAGIEWVAAKLGVN